MSKSKLGVVLLSSTLAVFVVIGGLLGKPNAKSSDDGAYKQMRVYEEVLARIRTDYVEEPDLKEVTDGALHGLLESLDTQSSYLTPDEYAEYQKRKGSSKDDVGMTLAKKFGYVAVISAQPGTPAGKAGLASGDIIEAIDNTSTREMSLEKVEDTLSGKAGSTVALSVIRASRVEPQKITLTRANINPPAMVAKQAEPGIGYLRIEALPKGRSQEIAAKVHQLVSGGAKSLVLDLRNSASGDISEAIATADLFLNHGLITYLQGQKVPRQNFDASTSGTKIKIPIAVLVNRATAGPAEVLAAALSENGRGELVGEKTYGVGSMMKIVPLDDGSALLLSVAKYYTPGGKAIQDNGLTPGVLVAESMAPPPFVSEDEEAAPAPAEEAKPATEDMILKKALEMLRAVKS